MHTKKKVLIIVTMVVLLAVTTVVNIMLNKNVDQPINKPNVDEPVSQFVSMRINRETTNTATLVYLKGIIESQTASVEAKESASKLEKKLIEEIKLISDVEGQIKLLGYADAIIKLNETNIQVVIAADSVTATDIGKVGSLIVASTHYGIADIVISSRSYI